MFRNEKNNTSATTREPAFRIIGASVKSAVCTFSLDQPAAASRTKTGGERMFIVGRCLPNPFYMFTVTTSSRNIRLLQGGCNALYLLIVDNFRSILLDRRDQLSPIDNVCTFNGYVHRGFPGKGDDRNNRISAAVRQSLPYSTDMRLILPHWIGKCIFITIEILCPLFAVFVSEYPAFVVLRFDDEYSILGHHDMVYLRRSSVCFQDHVVKNTIVIGQKRIEPCRYDPFAHTTFYLRSKHSKRNCKSDYYYPDKYS